MGYKKNILPFDPIKFQQLNYDSRQTKYVLKDPDKKFNWCGLQKVGNIDRYFSIPNIRNAKKEKLRSTKYAK